MGFTVKVADLNAVTQVDKDVSAILLQYPDTEGTINNVQGLIEKTHAAGVILHSFNFNSINYKYNVLTQKLKNRYTFKPNKRI